jgi:predicted lipoprotein with Yx(FWY)xxD motif
MKRFAIIALAAAALAGCGGGAYGGSSSNSSSNAAATSSAARTLYTFARDTKGMSNCSGACAQEWMPAKPGSKTPSGIDKAKVATITRSDGSKQLAVGGKPLYTFVGDKKPGDATGDGVNAFGGVWSNASGSAGGSSAPSSGRYGY